MSNGRRRQHDLRVSTRAIVVLLLAFLAVGLASTSARAEPPPMDDRCGDEISLSPGAPTDGWTHADDGRMPGKAGNPCWMRIDLGALAPRVLRLSGADGRKSVTLFDGAGRRLLRFNHHLRTIASAGDRAR